MNPAAPLRPAGALMILRSTVLGGDSALEAAAMFDSDRISPGATGSHVHKIQQALNQVGRAHLVPDGVYGPRTEAAVRAYQARHGIVDHGRRRQFEGSVDRRTLLTLDRELLDTRWHRRYTHPHGC